MLPSTEVTGHPGVVSEPRGWAFEGSMLATPVLGAVLGLVLAVATTTAVLALVFEDGGSDGGEGAILGVILIFLVAWLASFVLMSVCVGIWLAGRPALRSHNRVVVTLLLGLWVPISVVAAGVAAWFGYRTGLEYAGVGLGVVIAIGFISAGPALTDKARRERLLFTVAGVAAVFVLAVVVLQPGHRRSIYASNPPPMGLISQSELSAALPLWHVAGYQDAPRDGGWPYAGIDITTARGAEFDVTFVPNRTSCSSAFGSCAIVGTLDDGSAVSVWTDDATCGSSGQSYYISMSVQRPEGVWSADSKNRCSDPLPPSIDELRTLMTLIRPATIAEWVDAT